MKQILTILLVLLVFAAGILLGMKIKPKRLDAQATNQQFVELLDDVAYSYGPLKFMTSGELDKAKSLLHPRLGDSLRKFNEFVDRHPEIRARNTKMIEDAQELYDREKKTDPAL